MNDTQWLFEYKALIEKERLEMARQERLFEAQQQMMSNYLGLNLFSQEGEFIPLAVMCGTPEILAKLSEEAEHEAKAADAANDPEFDEWSERMARGEVDFEDDLLPMPEEEPLIQFTKSPTISWDDD